MKKLILKSFFYTIMILIALELLVRLFYLGKDNPVRFVDPYQVEKWVPNQEGYSVTGNRRQNFSKYHINQSGYNSYREFTPSKDKLELALVGDSFIEGFHQPYYNSIGKKIEHRLPNLEVYEYGYAGYDLADQLHLIQQYQSTFDMIDYVVLGLKFENDLTRGTYKVISSRIQLESPIYRLVQQSKLLVYAQNIGALAPFWTLAGKISSLVNPSPPPTNLTKKESSIDERHQQYLANFKELVKTYGFDKNRFVFLMDLEITPPFFIDYLKEHQFKFMDVSGTLKASKTPTTLIYDRHWNDHGRSLVAELIANYYKNQLP